jgi:hypothetical protein
MMMAAQRFANDIPRQRSIRSAFPCGRERCPTRRHPRTFFYGLAGGNPDRMEARGAGGNAEIRLIFSG